MASRTNVSCYLDYVSILAGGKKAIWFCVVRCRACCYSSLFFLLADVCLLAMRTKCHIRLSTYYMDVWWWPSSHRRWTESSIFCVICATMWTFFSVIILISIFSGYLFVLFFFSSFGQNVPISQWQANQFFVVGLSHFQTKDQKLTKQNAKKQVYCLN